MTVNWIKYFMRVLFALVFASLVSACGQDGPQEEDENGQQEEGTQQQEEEGGDEGDDPTDTPPPTTHGEEIDATSCIVARPRYHMTNARTIANLDGEYGNTPFQDGANLLRPFLPSLPASPGVFVIPWDLTAMPNLAAAAGAGAVINANVHLFYVEFPVNDADLCVPKAWEAGESWLKGTAYAGNETNGFVRRNIADFTKFPVAGAVPVPGTEIFTIPQTQWIRGNGRGDANFPEAWIFVDGPGLYRSHVGETDAGNYVNIRLNIRDGSTTGAIKGTAIFRIAQRLALNGTFTSRLGGSSGAGSDVMDTPPVVDPSLNTSGLPANPPATIQSVFGSHPDYVGTP